MKTKLPLILFTVAGLLACEQRTKAETTTPAATQSNSKLEEATLELRGAKLTGDEVAALETKLAQDPEDLLTRRELLGYYFQAQFRSTDARQARQKLILWLIEHHPDFTAIRTPYTGLNEIVDVPAYDEGETLWLKAVESHPQNATILGNAAEYFLILDQKTAEGLFKKAQALEPDNAYSSQRLGFLYGMEARSMLPDKDFKQMATSELHEFQLKKLAALEKGHTPGTAPDFYNLCDLSKTAFAAGEFGKARNYATELLSQAQSRSGDWNYGNAIHDGNMILGAGVALHDGNLEDARKFLRGSRQNARVSATRLVRP